MKRVICISGDAASGKTTASRGVLEVLKDWSRQSAGEICRTYCAEQGISTEEIPQLGDEFHREVDRRMLAAIRESSRLVAEGRLVGYLAREMDDVLRVYCHCPIEERARRHQQRESQDGVRLSLREAREAIELRDAADARNLRHLYGIDYHNPGYYQLILDTSLLGRHEVITAIVAAAISASPPP